MASWGRKADFELTGTGSIDANTSIVTGANTAFTEELEIRNLIDLDGNGIFIVTSIIDDETLLVEPVAESDATNEAILLSEVPKYLTTTQAIDEATFITIAEAQNTGNRADGIKTPGWNLYKEYVNANGDTRRVVETLVAMKQTSIT
jgi:hypothetical protein